MVKRAVSSFSRLIKQVSFDSESVGHMINIHIEYRKLCLFTIQTGIYWWSITSVSEEVEH